jgi:hypothetical protein
MYPQAAVVPDRPMFGDPPTLAAEKVGLLLCERLTSRRDAEEHSGVLSVHPHPGRHTLVLFNDLVLLKPEIGKTIPEPQHWIASCHQGGAFRHALY